ncbi:GNAT family N-acetyltransferase [Colwellia sp. MSW7]|uniref:GNAT family N-acetyltransferase n=1 Tax=Colwellia maritima TaxID=2912588 RepID=A0ABS9X657_9GAMM|nr:GNAT family N-acetyltransferase [Colwellia maritima]MCI2285712.1 GNAT family N-acetyltransferase [Colwellia maritima]
MMIQNSKRLSYRLMGEEDAHALWSIDQDPEVMHFLNGGTPKEYGKYS